MLCYPCKADRGEDREAVKLVPQTADPEGSLHYVPVCEAHLDWWFDDCDEEFAKLPVFELK